MDIYIGFIIVVLLIGYGLKVNISYKRKKIFLVVTFLFLTILSAVRAYSVGNDTRQYYVFFNIINKTEWSSYDTLRYEFGYFALNKLCYYISTNPQVLLVITSILIIPAIGYFILKNSDDVVMSTFIYITFNIFAADMSMVRQSIAISFFIIGLEQLKEGKVIRYILIILIASLFHSSVLFLLLLIFLPGRKYSYRTYVFTIFLGAIAFFAAEYIYKFIGNYLSVYENYFDSKYNFSNYNASTVEMLKAFIILSIGVIYTQQKSNNLIDIGKKSSRWLKVKVKKRKCVFLNKPYEKKDFLSYMMSIWFVILMMVIKYNFFNRVAMYFSVFSLIWLPLLIKSVKNKQQKAILQILILLIPTIYYLVIAYCRPEWHGVVPYISYWKQL